MRLQVKAHPSYQYMGQSFENFLMFLPIGYGYCSEETLDRNLQTHYDGLAPSVWWYFNLIRWWPKLQEDVQADLESRGVGWKNPATSQSPDLGVTRDIVLQAGENYRFVIHYANRDMTWGVVSTALHAVKPNGNGRENPLKVTIYLAEIMNYQSPLQAGLNHSRVIHGHDRKHRR